jgi:hypothetical protein
MSWEGRFGDDSMQLLLNCPKYNLSVPEPEWSHFIPVLELIAKPEGHSQALESGVLARRTAHRQRNLIHGDALIFRIVTLIDTPACLRRNMFRTSIVRRAGLGQRLIAVDNSPSVKLSNSARRRQRGSRLSPPFCGPLFADLG